MKCAQLSFYGDNYGLRGRGLEKVASHGMNHDDAMFTLCLGGLSAPAAAQALHSAEKKGSVEVHLAPTGTRNFKEQEKVASEKIKEIHALRRGLLKEAAALPDSMTIDSVLSLGFINSENIDTFISKLPYLEKALNVICELLLASRLGVTEIPENAASRCAKALDEVVQGLKALALREIRDVS